MKKFQVAFVGVNTLYGGTSALLLKQSPFIKCLKLFDGKNVDSAIDISLINTQCKIKTYLGNERMEEAFEGADIVILNDETNQFYDMDSHLLSVCGNYTKYAKVISTACPEAVVVLSSSPVNCLLPMMSYLLAKNGCYNPNKVVGSTSIDTIRASALLASRFNLDPKDVVLPVVGGSSELTRVPLFSQARPLFTLHESARMSLIEDIKRGENLVLASKGNRESMSRAHATVRFVNSILAGLRGDPSSTDITFCRTNLVPGVEYFSLPVTFGRRGIDNRFGLPSTIDADEDRLIDEAIKNVKKDVDRSAFVVKEAIDGPSLKYLSTNDRASSQKEIFDLYVKSLAEPRNEDYSFKNIVDDDSLLSPTPVREIVSASPSFVPRVVAHNPQETNFIRPSNASFCTPIYTLEPLGCPSASASNFDDIDGSVAFDRRELLHENQMAKFEDDQKQTSINMDPIAKLKRLVDVDFRHDPSKNRRVDSSTTAAVKIPLFDNLTTDKSTAERYGKTPFFDNLKADKVDKLATEKYGKPPLFNNLMADNCDKKLFCLTSKNRSSSKIDVQNEINDDKYKKLAPTLFDKLNSLKEGFYLPSRNHYNSKCRKQFTENAVRTRSHSTSAVVPTKAPYKISRDCRNDKCRQSPAKKTELPKLICDKCRKEMTDADSNKGEKIVEKKSVESTTDVDMTVTETAKNDLKLRTKKKAMVLENEINSERLKRLKDKINEKLIPLLSDKKLSTLSIRKSAESSLVVGNSPKPKPKSEWKGVPFVVGKIVGSKKIDSDKDVAGKKELLDVHESKNKCINKELKSIDENSTTSANEPKLSAKCCPNDDINFKKLAAHVGKVGKSQESPLFVDDETTEKSESRKHEFSKLQLLGNKYQQKYIKSTNEESPIKSSTKCQAKNDENSTIPPDVSTEVELSKSCEPQPPNEKELSTEMPSNTLNDIVETQEKQETLRNIEVVSKLNTRVVNTVSSTKSTDSSAIPQIPSGNYEATEFSKSLTKARLRLLSEAHDKKRLNLVNKLSAAVKIAMNYQKLPPSREKARRKYRLPSVSANILEGFVFPSLKTTTIRRRGHNLLTELSTKGRIVDKPRKARLPLKWYAPSTYKNVYLYKKTLRSEAREVPGEYKNEERAARSALRTILNRRPIHLSSEAGLDGKGTFLEFRRQLAKTSKGKRKTTRNAFNVVERKLRRGVRMDIPNGGEVVEMPTVRRRSANFGDVYEFIGSGVDKKRIAVWNDVAHSGQLSEYAPEFVVPSLKDTRETFHLEEN